MPKRLKQARPTAAAVKLLDPGKAERDRFYTGKRWRRLRALILSRNPLCLECSRQGRVTAADTVHHLVERLVAPELAYRESNLEAICTPCHTRRHKSHS